MSAQKDIEVHVVLIEEAVVLLQRQDDKLVLRCMGKEDRTSAPATAPNIVSLNMHNPIIRLDTILTRSVANGEFLPFVRLDTILAMVVANWGFLSCYQSYASI